MRDAHSVTNNIFYSYFMLLILQKISKTVSSVNNCKKLQPKGQVIQLKNLSVCSVLKTGMAHEAETRSTEIILYNLDLLAFIPGFEPITMQFPICFTDQNIWYFSLSNIDVSGKWLFYVY